MKHKFFVVSTSFLLAACQALSQEPRPAIDRQADDEPDSSATAQIINEGTNRSQVMEILSYVTDVYGPRLTWSPGYKRAAEWARSKLASMGLVNSRIEGWEPMGRSWEIKHYSANVLGSQVFPLLSYPKAWSPGVDETGEVILLDAKTDSALDTFKGKLKDKFVLMGGTKEVDLKPGPTISRMTDAELLELANADVPRQRRRRRRVLEDTPEAKKRAALEHRKQLMVYEEGALAILTPGSYDGGSLQVMSAGIPTHPDTPWTNRPSIWAPKASKVLPQIAVVPEHYNRLARMLQKGERFKLDLQFDVAFAKEDSGYNVIAEIPGTDLKDEVVMIGAHLDSWHGGTGATDDGTGVAVCMEAVRILKATGLKPRRTIRIGLWGGEEQGLLGSKAFVKRYLGERASQRGDSVVSKPTYKPEADKFSVYFNDDNGTGKFRGIYMERNEAVRPIFRKWFVPFGKENEFTLTISPTGGTDHQSFDGIGLPAFQFIQDDIEYFTKTWHSTMDVYDHAIADDLKQGAMIMAGFAYNAAMRDEMIPRKPIR